MVNNNTDTVEALAAIRLACLQLQSGIDPTLQNKVQTIEKMVEDLSVRSGLKADVEQCVLGALNLVSP